MRQFWNCVARTWSRFVRKSTGRITTGRRNGPLVARRGLASHRLTPVYPLRAQGMSHELAAAACGQHWHAACCSHAEAEIEPAAEHAARPMRMVSMVRRMTIF
jgi:hypothetical protein